MTRNARLRPLYALLLGVTVLTGCSHAQIADWLVWHDYDPLAANEYANRPLVQLHALLDWDHDGLIEPDPPPATAPARTTRTTSTGGGSVWDRIAQCESNGRWDIDTGNGFYGGVQFTLTSWRAAGGNGYPHHASRAEQIRVAENLLTMQGWGAWPTCSRILGLR